MIRLILIVIVVNLCKCQDTYSNTLEDCEAFSSLFENTCVNKPSQSNLDFTSLASVTESCSNAGICPDGSSNTYCEWKRILCVTCYRVNIHTVIRIQTNGLPNHCYYSPYKAPLSSPVDFSVIFNPKTSADSLGQALQLNTILDTQEDITRSQCDKGWSFDQGVPTDSDYLIISNSSNFDKIIGVSINGVFLRPGISELGYDAFYPNAYSLQQDPIAIDPDLCLGSTQYTTAYHYYMFSPCILDQKLKNVEPQFCSANARCSIDKQAYTLKLMSSDSKTIVPIGLAKDGKIIYGPYNQFGQLWQSCDVDVCNGRIINGHYSYVTTLFYPYYVGCWGPGNIAKNLAPECSSNQRACSNALNIQRNQLKIFLSIAFVNIVLIIFN
eukprot:403362035